MATTITSTIGSTGDYTTLQAWEDASPANLVSSDEIWRGEVLDEELVSASSILTIAGQTVDSTRYVELTAEAGASFMDHVDRLTNGLRYNASNGAAIRSTVGFSVGITVSTAYTRISRLQIKTTDYSNTGTIRVTVGNTLFDNLIVEGRENTNFKGVIYYNGGGGTARNVLVIHSSGNTYTGGFAVDAGGTLLLYNCTSVRPSNLSSIGSGFIMFYATITMVNCSGFGFDNFYLGHGTTSCSNNASDKTIGFGSNNQASLTYADQFETTSDATALDLRTKSGSAQIDNGTSTSGNGVTTDIVGTSRSGTYDIGVWEFAGAAAEDFIPRVIFM